LAGRRRRWRRMRKGEDGEPRIRVIEPMEELFNVFK
jgi:hypothetical protein